MDLSYFLHLADAVSFNIMNAVERHGGFSLNGIAIFLTGLATVLIVSYGMATAAGYIAITLIEQYIVTSLGVILLGFAGSDYTRNYALNYIRALVHIGLKLFLVSVIAFIGGDMMLRVTNELASSTDADSIISECMTLIGTALFFVAIVKIIPGITDTLIAGTSIRTSEAGAAMRGGAMAAAGMVAGAAVTAYKTPGAIADAGNAVKEAASAFSSTFSEHKSSYESKGMNSIRAGVSAFGNTLWNAYRGTGGFGNPRSQTGTADAAEVKGNTMSPGSSGPSK